MKEKLIPIGKIERMHGLRGEVKVRPLTDFPERFAPTTSVYVVKGDSTKRLSISSSRPHKAGTLIAFADIDQPDDAERLVGSTICVEEHEMPSPPQNTYFIHELIGFDVFDEGDNRLGELTEVWQLPANDVFVVRDEEAFEMLFPAIKDAVKNISREEKRIVVVREFGVT
jgi:16S rRNA processing protein RimM